MLPSGAGGFLRFLVFLLENKRNITQISMNLLQHLLTGSNSLEITIYGFFIRNRSISNQVQDSLKFKKLLELHVRFVRDHFISNLVMDVETGGGAQGARATFQRLG